jgi:hypothetical protein
METVRLDLVTGSFRGSGVAAEDGCRGLQSGISRFQHIDERLNLRVRTKMLRQLRRSQLLTDTLMQRRTGVARRSSSAFSRLQVSYDVLDSRPYRVKRSDE